MPGVVTENFLQEIILAILWSCFLTIKLYAGAAVIVLLQKEKCIESVSAATRCSIRILCTSLFHYKRIIPECKNASNGVAIVVNPTNFTPRNAIYYK